MRERAIVKEIKGDMVTVSIELQEGCAVCVNNGRCKIRKSHLSVYNKDHIDIDEGDRVVVEIRTSEQAKSAFWVLGFPLIMLFVGYGFGAFIFKGSGEGPAVVCAGLGFIFAMGIGMLIQYRRKLKSFPYILGKEGEIL